MKYLKSIIPVSIGLACIYYSASTLSQDDINSIIKSFAKAKYSWVFFGVILGGLSHVSRSYRWKYLLKPLGYNISFLNSVLAFFAASDGIVNENLVERFRGLPIYGRCCRYFG